MSRRSATGLLANLGALRASRPTVHTHNFGVVTELFVAASEALS